MLSYSAPATSWSAASCKPCDLVAGAGFEPAASSSRTEHARRQNRRLMTFQHVRGARISRDPGTWCRRAACSRSLGAVVAAGHPQGNSRQLPCPSRETRPGRGPNPPRARLLPPGAPGPHVQEHSASARRALAACLSRVPRRVARTVLRGPWRGNAPGLPGYGSGEAQSDGLRRGDRVLRRSLSPSAPPKLAGQGHDPQP